MYLQGFGARAIAGDAQQSLQPQSDLKHHRDEEEGQLSKVDYSGQSGRFLRWWSLKAFFVTAVACLLLSAVPWVYYRHIYVPRYMWPVYGDITQECLQKDSWHPISKSRDGESWRYESKTSLEIPLSGYSNFPSLMGRSLLRSGGHNIGGHIKMRTSAEQRVGFASVHVKISYRHKKALELTKTCRLRRRDWQTGVIAEGVGIFTPEYDLKYGHNLRPVDYYLEFILPKITTSALVMDFDAEVPNTSHEIVDTNGTVTFNNLRLKGTNGRIRVESVSVHNGWFSTTNGDIEGVFNATQNLILLTTQAAIRVDVGLEQQYTPPFFSARASNGLITANFSLTNRVMSREPFYDISTTTSNAGLTVDFQSAPSDSRLKYQGITTNGRVHVSLNPASEVSYKLHTTGREAPKVVRRPDIKDPSGKNRTRVVTGDWIDNDVSGRVLWGTFLRGEVTVETTNAPIIFVV